MSEERKSIGAGKLSKVPDKRLRLAIGEGAVKTEHLAEGAVTPGKISSDFIGYVTKDVQNQIDSIQIGGWAISNQLGDDPHIGISQQALTELIGYDHVPDSIRGRIQAVEDEIGTDTTSDSLSGRITSLEGAVGSGGSVDTRIAQAKSQIIGDAGNNYNTLGKLEDRIQEESSARHTAVSGEATRAQGAESQLNAKIDTSVTTINTKINTDVTAERDRALGAEELLRQAYEALTQTSVVVGTLPSSGVANTIYRVPGTNSYKDYMWNGSQFVEMAEYDNAIDEEPLQNSSNLVKSEGVYYKTHSLFPVNYTPNTYIDDQGKIKKGGSSNGADIVLTDFIQISNEDSVYIQHGLVADVTIGCALYDSDKEFLSGYSYNNSGGYRSFTVDNANAAFIRASVALRESSYVNVNNTKYSVGGFSSDILNDIDYLPHSGNFKIITSDAVGTEFFRRDRKPIQIVSDSTRIYAAPIEKFGLKAGDIISIENKGTASGSITFLDANKDDIITINYPLEQYNKAKRTYAKIPDNTVYLYGGWNSGGYNLSITVLDYYAAESSYVSEEMKTTLFGLDVNVPQLPIISTSVSVSDATGLLNAISQFNEGSADMSIILYSDIALLPDNLIAINNNGKNLSIVGNGHKLYIKGGAEYTPEGYTGNYAYSTYEVPPSGGFVAEDGELVENGKSKVYVAQSAVLNEDGTTSDSTAGIKKLLLPQEIVNISIDASDGVYIYYNQAYTRRSAAVTKVEDGYVYFEHPGGYDPNASSKITFRFSNVKDGKGYYIRDNKVFYPAKYAKLYNPIYNNSPVNIVNTSGIVALYNIEMKSAINYNKPFISTDNAGTVIIQGCKLIGCYTGIYDIGAHSGGYLYVDKCYFENIKTFGVYPANQHAIITHNKSYNVGTCEYNYGQHLRAGTASSYIGYNELIDYGYCGIIASSTTCVVEHNVLKYTPEYAEYAKIGLVEDGGSIYTGQLNTDLIIRYNKVINYSGLHSNHAIYLDDGVYNVKVIGNIVENVISKYSYAIFAYRKNDIDNYKNTNRIIAQNIVDGSIRFEGSARNTPNACYMGHNLICSSSIGTGCYINDLQGQEEQFITKDASVKDGFVQSMCNFESWIN